MVSRAFHARLVETEDTGGSHPASAERPLAHRPQEWTIHLGLVLGRESVNIYPGGAVLPWMTRSVFGCCLALFVSSVWAQEAPSFATRLAAAALERTQHAVVYDPAYVVIDYPGGDVPADRGVCSDVVIRAYRVLGLDLQKLVHEDMKRNFRRYPQKWGLKRPDKNIDHRRVPNLQRFFKRQGAGLPISKKVEDYQVGDVVAWDLNGKGLTHIGVVVAPPGKPDERWIVHNIGQGPKLEDALFDWKIIGHYRYAPKRASR